MIKINTKDILFIIGGAFSGIEEIIKRRLGEKVIGFSKSDELNDTDAIISKAKHEDLVKFLNYSRIYWSYSCNLLFRRA